MLLSDLPAAVQDGDLSSRAVAAAALAGESDPENFQWRNRYAIVAAPVTDDGSPLVEIFVYARDGAKVERPGFDPTVVTDEHIKAAVKHVRDGASAPAA